MPRIGLILAGGQARRMAGADKAELRLGECRLIDHVIARLAPQCDAVMISGREDYGTGLPVIADAPTGPAGPAAGLYAATRAFRAAPETILITTPVDTPFLPHDLVERLCAKELPAMAASGEQEEPGFTAWTVGMLQAQMADLGPADAPALGALARNANARTVAFDNPRAFLNLNTPEELEAARRDEV